MLAGHSPEAQGSGKSGGGMLPLRGRDGVAFDQTVRRCRLDRGPGQLAGRAVAATPPRRRKATKPVPSHLPKPQTPGRAARRRLLYWVIKGIVQVRQPLLDIAEGHKEDGTPCCLLILKTSSIAVRPTPRRAFQGWRYLEPGRGPARPQTRCRQRHHRDAAKAAQAIGRTGLALKETLRRRGFWRR